MKLAVYKVPEPVKLVSVPLVIATSPVVKSLAVSDKLKVKLTDSSELKKVSLAVMVRLGTTVSIDKLSVLEARLLLPAESVNFVESTLILTLAVELASGVKVAV